MSVVEGLDFILWHLWDPTSNFNMYPRRISTGQSQGRQFVVTSRAETLKYFDRAAYVDCRISAYPFVIKHPPNFIFIDIDRNKFEYKNDFIGAVRNSLATISRIGGKPSVIWSGNGYHIYLPMHCKTPCNEEDLEKSIVERFDKLEIDDDERVKIFLKFCEQHLSNYESDPKHTPSIHSCMLRVPNTINSKNDSKVTICEKWNGVRPSICNLMWDFYLYLNKIKEPSVSNVQLGGATEWIETVLERGIGDHRKYLLWRVMCPYLVNVLKLDNKDSISVLREWLSKCNKINKLDFNMNSEIRSKLSSVNGYFPLSLSKINTYDANVYDDIINLINNSQPLNKELSK